MLNRKPTSTHFVRSKASCCRRQVMSNSLRPQDRSTPGLPVLYHLPEFAQVHVHWIGDAIQPSYPLSSPSPPAFNLSQHQGLSQWVSFSHQVAKVLELQHQVLPMRIQGWFPLGCTSLVSLQSQGLSRVLSSTTVWKHQFFGTQPSWAQMLGSYHWSPLL